MNLTGGKGPKPLILGSVSLCFFQELKLLMVLRRRVAVVDGGGGGGGIIHSLASDDISGNTLQLDSEEGGGGGARPSWDRIGPVRQFMFVKQTAQPTSLAGLPTDTTTVFVSVFGGKIPGFAVTNRRTRAHTSVGRVSSLSESRMRFLNVSM